MWSLSSQKVLGSCLILDLKWILFLTWVAWSLGCMGPSYFTKLWKGLHIWKNSCLHWNKLQSSQKWLWIEVTILNLRSSAILSDNKIRYWHTGLSFFLRHWLGYPFPHIVLFANWCIYSEKYLEYLNTTAPCEESCF